MNQESFNRYKKQFLIKAFILKIIIPLIIMIVSITIFYFFEDELEFAKKNLPFILAFNFIALIGGVYQILRLLITLPLKDEDIDDNRELIESEK